MSTSIDKSRSLPPLALLGFLWSTALPLVSVQFVSWSQEMLPNRARTASPMLAQWVFHNFMSLRYVLLGIAMMCAAISLICAVRKSSAYTAMRAALAASLLAGFTTFAVLVLCLIASFFQ